MHKKVLLSTIGIVVFLVTFWFFNSYFYKINAVSQIDNLKLDRIEKKQINEFIQEFGLDYKSFNIIFTNSPQEFLIQTDDSKPPKTILSSSYQEHGDNFTLYIQVDSIPNEKYVDDFVESGLNFQFIKTICLISKSKKKPVESVSFQEILDCQKSITFTKSDIFFTFRKK